MAGAGAGRARRLRGGPWRVIVSLFGTTGAVLVSGLVTSKIGAVLLGPEGVGRLAIGQGVVLVTGVVATISTHEGMVRFIATRAPLGHTADLAGARRMVLGIVAGMSVVVAAAGVVGHSLLGRLLFPGTNGTALVLGSLLGGLLYAGASVQLALTTAYRRVDLFALGTSIGAATTPVVSSVGFWLWRSAGIAPVLIVSNAASLAVAAAVLQRLHLHRCERQAPAPGAPGPMGHRAVARELLGFGAPQMLFHLTALSMMVITPLLAQDVIGPEGVGWFRAAFTLAAAMGALLTYVIGQELFPHLASLVHRREAFTEATNQGVRVVALAAGALVAAGMAGAEPALRIVFSEEFVAAANLFRWLLLAELLRQVAMVLSSAVAAVRGSGLKLGAGVFAAVASAGASAALLRSHGLVGAGAGPAAGNLASLALIIGLAYALTPARLSGATLGVLGVEALALAALFAVSATGPWWLSCPAAAGAAMLFGAMGWSDGRATLRDWSREHGAVAAPARPPGRGRVSPPWPPTPVPRRFVFNPPEEARSMEPIEEVTVLHR